MSLPAERKRRRRRRPPAAARGLAAAVLVIVGAGLSGTGCATYSAPEPLDEESALLAADELMHRAMDPMRPIANRVMWAKQLQPEARRELEQRLLTNLPEFWGLEWRARLALLTAIGGREAHARLEELAASRTIPTPERAQQAIATALHRMADRLGPASEGESE